MSDLLSQLGIDWHILIAQMVNFAVLLLVLAKFVYQPIIRLLDERRTRIAEGEKKNRLVEEKLSEIAKLKEAMLEEARWQSEALIEQSGKDAAALRERMFREAGEEVERRKRDGVRALEADRQKLREEIKREAGELIAAAIEHALGDLASREIEEKLAAEALRIMRESARGSVSHPHK